MNTELSTPEQRLLWMLVAHPDGAFENDLKPSNAKAIRESLSRHGMIEIEKRVKSGSKRKVQSTFLRLTDSGWAWCNQNMAWTKPRGKAEQFLNELLQRLKLLIERQRSAASLADFINSTVPSANDQPSTLQDRSLPIQATPSTPTNLDERIRAACLQLGGGREAVRVRLADLREILADVAHDELSAAVLKLSRNRELTLYPLDDPRQIRPEDETAAINSSTGVPQHILYYGGIAS